MHAVNNGPVYKFASDQRITNIDHFRAAGIPYAKTHDAELVREEIFTSGEFSAYVKMPLFSTYLLKIIKE